VSESIVFGSVRPSGDVSEELNPKITRLSTAIATTPTITHRHGCEVLRFAGLGRAAGISGVVTDPTVPTRRAPTGSGGREAPRQPVNVGSTTIGSGNVFVTVAS
jgi:hypothetical protein